MSAEALEAETTPLEERLIALIRANGPISVADYMADALGHPHDGYYMARCPVGAEGDFTTAPEISQIFGELVGLWIVQTWIDMGSPAEFNLVELGPGRGVLMADIFRAARLRHEFLDAAKVTLVETSGRLRHEQQKRLRGGSPPVDWRDSFGETPEGPAIIIANEFLDCLPIRQFVRTKSGWRERLVGLDANSEKLAFTLDDTPPAPDTPLPHADRFEEGDIWEINEPAHALIDAVADRLKTSGGRALFIDYGHDDGGPGDTLQAVRRHAFWPVLTAPGAADVTAHVNFAPLARLAIDKGIGVDGPVSQGAFLEALGLSVRTHRLCAGKSPEESAGIAAGAHRLAAPGEMGELFKAFCLSAPGLPTPAGFPAA